jgi:toxin ParE1/3/4
MPSFRLAKKADLDLVEIYVYGTERFGQGQAEAYQAELTACFRSLAEHPLMGRQKITTRHRLRVFFHRSHLIAYQKSRAGIVIIRVLGGRQDWRQILQDG